MEPIPKIKTPPSTNFPLDLKSAKSEALHPTAKEDDSLENLLLDKVESFSMILNQVELEVGTRKKLFQNIVYTLDLQYSYLKAYFIELDQWEAGRNRSIELRRSRLEQQLNQLLAERRLEQARCWKDIALLQKESRQWLKQYRDLLQRVKIVLPQGKLSPEKKLQIFRKIT